MTYKTKIIYRCTYVNYRTHLHCIRIRTKRCTQLSNDGLRVSPATTSCVSTSIHYPHLLLFLLQLRPRDDQIRARFLRAGLGVENLAKFCNKFRQRRLVHLAPLDSPKPHFRRDEITEAMEFPIVFRIGNQSEGSCAVLLFWRLIPPASTTIPVKEPKDGEDVAHK